MPCSRSNPNGPREASTRFYGGIVGFSGWAQWASAHDVAWYVVVLRVRLCVLLPYDVLVLTMIAKAVAVAAANSAGMLSMTVVMVLWGMFACIVCLQDACATPEADCQHHVQGTHHQQPRSTQLQQHQTCSTKCIIFHQKSQPKRYSPTIKAKP